MTMTFTGPLSLAARLRTILAARDVIVHDGRTLRRMTLAGRAKAGFVAGAVALVGFSGYGAAQAATRAAEATGLVAPTTSDARLAAIEEKVDAMQTRVATIRHTAQLHATRVEQRQALIAAALTGKGDTKKLALATLAIDPAAERLAANAIAPLKQVEARQVALAGQARQVAEERMADARDAYRKLGLKPGRVIPQAKGSTAQGGPLVAVGSAEAAADLKADAEFRSLFQTWKKLDGFEQASIAIPSVQPVGNLSFTSNFGIRSDPFRGTAAMHAGVDIPGPVGTPIYATADGVIAHAGRQGGYGNLVEVNHGKGIATRYGHLSRILVGDNTRVKRGQLIGLMGSTGRSTGSHLHYEVRIDGHAVNPVPFLTTADYLLAAQDRAVHQIPVSTGPAPLD